MPRLKPIDPTEDHQDHSYTGLAGLAERAIGFMIPGFRLDSSVLKKDPLADVPRVGKYYADYSGLTPEEAEATDPEIEELFKNSRPASR